MTHSSAARVERLFLALVLLACERNDVNAEAREWAHQMGIPIRGASCSDVDSDGDGYVSCSLNTGGDKPDIVRIECRLYVGTNGCKVASDIVKVR